MDFRFTPDEQAFLKEVQTFIDQLLPNDWMGVDPDGHNEQADEELHQFDLEVRKKLAARAGWAAVAEAIRRPGIHYGQTVHAGAGADIPRRSVLGHIGGSHDRGYDLAVRYRRAEREVRTRIARGEMQWCIGMSEPDAGSDLANLKLRAPRMETLRSQRPEDVADGAYYADWSIVYARTDPNVKKQKGITTFLLT